MYSVKSGYKALYDENLQNPVLPLEAVAQKTFWHGIWKLKVLGKINHFFWKSVSNSLPTKFNLVNRKNLQDPMCHLCSSVPENVVHAFWGCEKIKHIWSQNFGWVDQTAAVDFSFKDLVEKNKGEPPDFGTLCCHSLGNLAP